MSTVNKVILIGNLTRDPEVRETSSGQVCNITVATDNRNSTSEYHKVVLFDKLAELTLKYLTKGKKVYIEGRLATRQYGDKTTGETKYFTEVIASDIQFLSPKTETQQEVPKQETKTNPYQFQESPRFSMDDQPAPQF